MATVELDAEFLALPLEAVRDAALERARALGCEHAEMRVERIRSQVARLRDGRLETSADDHELGLGLRVVHDGAFGFAATVELTADAAAALADQAVATARATAPAVTERVELAEEPSHGEWTWTSSYRLDPAEVPMADKVALARGLERTRAAVRAVWTTSPPTCSPSSRTSILPTSPAPSPPSAGSACTRWSRPPPSTARRRASRRCDRSPRLSAAAGSTCWATAGTGTRSLPASPSTWPRSCTAPTVDPGAYDLVIDPSNLWLTIHESIGHATELDRAMGYEAAYAGTSFATFDKLGTLRYGSGVMNVTGDRTVEHGLATVGYRRRGRAAQSFDLVRDGVLVGYQLDRRIARSSGLGPLQRLRLCRLARAHPHPADGQRLAAPGAAGTGPSTEELISASSDGFYVVGDKSWSIDMQRYNFQFTGPAVLQDREGPARRPGEGPRLPVHARPSSGGRWRQSAVSRPIAWAGR